METTFIYVTHDQVEAMTMASTIAIMSEGRLQQVGTPQSVYERPRNLFVARFIGSPPMNTIDGVMATEAGEAVVRVGTSTFPAGAAGATASRRVAGSCWASVPSTSPSATDR